MPTKPRTIEQLKRWYELNKLPQPEISGCYIGENRVGPKLFGVYRSGEEFIAYKSRANGTRVITYQGPDEAKAVYEIFKRLKDEVIFSEENLPRRKREESKQTSWSGATVLFAVGILAFVLWISLRGGPAAPVNGYYLWDEAWYYYQGGDWYAFEDAWTYTEPDAVLKEKWAEYYEGEEWREDMPCEAYQTEPAADSAQTN